MLPLGDAAVCSCAAAPFRLFRRADGSAAPQGQASCSNAVGPAPSNAVANAAASAKSFPKGRGQRCWSAQLYYGRREPRFSSGGCNSLFDAEEAGPRQAPMLLVPRPLTIMSAVDSSTAAPNQSIETDVLSAGVARLLSAAHLQR